MRRAITPRQSWNNAHQVALRLAREHIFLRARRIGIYWPIDGELDPRHLIKLKRGRTKIGYLPLLRPRSASINKEKLWFAPFQMDERLRLNRYKIPEPRIPGRKRVAVRFLDLLIIPIVGFDQYGHRLGVGGGFYDRTLAYSQKNRLWQRPHRVGVAHECQRLKCIQPRVWDISLELIVTELDIYRATCNNKLN